MYPSSTTSSAYPSGRVPTSTTSYRDERLSSGPLSRERAMMEEIRMKLIKSQRRMAHDHATTTSQTVYNSVRGAPMSMGITSTSSRHHYHHHHHHHHGVPSSSRHVQSRSHREHEHSNTQSTMGSSHYFPPDYRSARQPAVQSVYLEDLSSTINSSHHHAAPLSRAPTSYAPGGGGGVPPSSLASSYYVPALDETTRSSRRTTTHRHHHHYEVASEAPRAPVRSERHAVYSAEHHQHNQSVQKHHHHHRHDERKRRDDRVPAPPPSTRGILRTKSSASSQAPPSASIPYYGGDAAPPSSTFSSSNFLVYASSHGSVPLSSTGHYRRQPLSSNGQPERSALKQRRTESIPEDESEMLDMAAPVVPPPPSSRVRFEDELHRHVEYPPLVEEDEDADDSDPDVLPLHLHEGEDLPPYDPADDPEYHDDEDDDEVLYPYAPSPSPEDPFEPVVEIKQAGPVVHRSQENASVSNNQTPVASGSPRHHHHQKARSSFDKHMEMTPHRRRASSAARASPPLSPTNNHTRKSLTELPKSGINVLMYDQFDMRERRGSRERRSSAAAARSNDDVNPPAFQDPPKSYSREIPAFVEPELPLSPIDAYGDDEDYSDYGSSPPSPRHSMGSMHESDLASDDGTDAEAPALTFVTSGRATESNKPSPTSTEEYSSARAFPEGEDVDEEKAASAIHKIQSNDRPAAPTDESTTLDMLPPSSTYPNFWEEDATPKEFEEEKPEPAAEPAAEAEVMGPKTVEEPLAPVEEEEASVVSPPEEVAPLRSGEIARGPMQPHEHLLQYPPASQQRAPSKPMPLSQSMMLLAPPPSSTRPSHRPPPVSTHIRPSPATMRLSSSISSTTSVVRAPVTAGGALAGSNYVPRRLRPKTPASERRKVMPPSIGALSGLASGPVTFHLHVESFYEIVWQTGEFGFSFQRVYLEEHDDTGAPSTRRMFLRMLLNTERGTCPSFKEVRVGDVLIEVGGTRVCDIKLDQQGGGAALTKLFTELRGKTPLRLVFQRTDPTSWEGGVEL